MADLPDMSITIRSFEREDQGTCKRLYLEGMIGGKIAENDTGIDIDDIQSSYMDLPGNHFWVALDSASEIIGTIGLHHYEDGIGEIRRLRVRQDSQRRGIGSKLMEKALQYCQDHGYLKITLDTFVDREPALRLFQKFHFRHSRSRTVGEKELMYFYLDLYSRDKKQA